MQRTLERLHNSEKGEDTRRNGDESHQLRRKLWYSCSTVSEERCRYLLVMKVLKEVYKKLQMFPFPFEGSLDRGLIPVIRSQVLWDPESEFQIDDFRS